MRPFSAGGTQGTASSRSPQMPAAGGVARPAVDTEQAAALQSIAAMSSPCPAHSEQGPSPVDIIPDMLAILMDMSAAWTVDTLVVTPKHSPTTRASMRRGQERLIPAA
jgi:hypothetical protein